MGWAIVEDGKGEEERGRWLIQGGARNKPRVRERPERNFGDDNWDDSDNIAKQEQ